jgi:hypothetical protein
MKWAKKGALLTCSKDGKTWCCGFLRRFYGKKVASGRKGKEVLALYHRIA